VAKYVKGDEKEKDVIFLFYLKNRKGINNWDLVDLSAPKIIGKHLLNKDKSLLFKFAVSKNLWDRRIAVLSTYEFIKNNDFAMTLKISEMLLHDTHDLIHKAVGWMLREIGKRDLQAEENFLKAHYKKMPRTMLRYAIEKFSETKRKKYLQGKI
jgi:3-methyladenine DNA glycosylase AlkD